MFRAAQVDRVLSVRHGSQFDQVEAALKVLGKRVSISLEDDTRSGGIATAVATRPRLLAVGRSGRMAFKKSATKKAVSLCDDHVRRTGTARSGAVGEIRMNGQRSTSSPTSTQP
jgi:hypothetical protein